MALQSSLPELITRVRHDAASSEPADQLATALDTARELSTLSDSLLGYFIDQARKSDMSWTDISSVLGVSKQAVHKRFTGSLAGKPWLHRYTERTRSARQAATRAAIALNHHWVGTEHLLLGFFAEPESAAAKVLADHGIKRYAVELAIIQGRGRGNRPPVQEPELSTHAINALEDALLEALELGTNYIGTEHVLLALFHDPEALAARILTSMGCTEESARADVSRIM